MMTLLRCSCSKHELPPRQGRRDHGGERQLFHLVPLLVRSRKQARCVHHLLRIRLLLLLFLPLFLFALPFFVLVLVLVPSLVGLLLPLSQPDKSALQTRPGCDRESFLIARDVRVDEKEQGGSQDVAEDKEMDRSDMKK
eukprot:766700-Hanusia_phi.AAC.2